MSNPLSIYTPPPRPRSRPVQSHPTDIGLSLFKKARSSSQRASRYNPNSAFAKIGRRQTGGRPRVEEGVKRSSNITEVSRELEVHPAAAAGDADAGADAIDNNDDDDDGESHESKSSLSSNPSTSNDSFPSLEDLFAQTGPRWDSGAHTLRARHVKPSAGPWGTRQLERFRERTRHHITSGVTESLQKASDHSQIIPKPSIPGEERVELVPPPAPGQSATKLPGRPQKRKAMGVEGDGGGVGGGEGRKRVRSSV